MRVISVEDAAARLSVSPRSLIDKRYRLRLGLAAIKIGRHVGFAEHDIERLIERGRERLPGEARK